ncbi:MAG TPA: hypothetical protein VM582_05145 [Candidatus Thermoplasmatota archaeon]|nr:hypothetical protein [Candidatus Thermoplasmatota archaeon]
MADDTQRIEGDGRTHRTGGGELEPREVRRAAGGAVAEGEPRERDRRGSGGDVQPTRDGPAIQGIAGAPGANSVLGNKRGLSRPPHDAEGAP